ncbi:MAG TPA: hypothetical protein VFE51_11660 [Verrucomicrobiae bacterium]|nr:hypothetical protein [Verrucomicrobiae bacterium]
MEYQATKVADLTIKDIATDLLEVTVKTVRRNEKRWGLDKARYSVNKRVVRYRRGIVIRELLRRNLIEKTKPDCP